MSITPFFHVYHKYVFNMANINKIKLSGTTYSIQDENAALVSDVFITAGNRNSIQSRINEGIYSLSTDDVYTIVGTKTNATDVIKGLIIVDNVKYNFTGSTSSDVQGVSDLDGIVTFDLASPFSISLVDRDTNHINELFFETFTADGEESPMSNVVITHNPNIGVNKIDYVSTLYTEFVHEKYALADVVEQTKQDTLVSGTNIKTINNQSILGSGNITIQGGGGGASVIEVTQAEYDALVEAGTLDLTALYIITDATMVNIDDYVLKSENALNPVEILSHYEIREANTAQAFGTNFSTNKVYVTRRPSQNSSGNNNIRLRINTGSTSTVYGSIQFSVSPNNGVVLYNNGLSQYVTVTSIEDKKGAAIELIDPSHSIVDVEVEFLLRYRYVISTSTTGQVAQRLNSNILKDIIANSGGGVISNFSSGSGSYNGRPAAHFDLEASDGSFRAFLLISDNVTTKWDSSNGVSVYITSDEKCYTTLNTGSTYYYNLPDGSRSFSYGYPYYQGAKIRVDLDTTDTSYNSWSIMIKGVYHSTTGSNTTNYGIFTYTKSTDTFSLSTDNSFTTYFNWSYESPYLTVMLKDEYDKNRSGIYEIYQGNGRMYGEYYSKTDGFIDLVQGYSNMVYTPSQAYNNVNNKLGGMSLVKVTESEFEALTTKDANTLYVITPDAE